jgi:hypothetical protein
MNTRALLVAGPAVAACSGTVDVTLRKWDPARECFALVVEARDRDHYAAMAHGDSGDCTEQGGDFTVSSASGDCYHFDQSCAGVAEDPELLDCAASTWSGCCSAADEPVVLCPAPTP